MSEIIDLTINWNNGTIEQVLADLPEKFSEAAFQALDEGADFMKNVAKMYVRVDTGTLQKSIRKQRSGTGHKTVSVRAGGYFVNPKTGRKCDYAHWVELNYPFLRPAYETVKHYIISLIKQKVVEAAKQ
jgi:hypothetical protein